MRLSYRYCISSIDVDALQDDISVDDAVKTIR